MTERLNAHELMQRELADSATCRHCGEPRRAHYPGVLLGCRQGRTHFGLYNSENSAYSSLVK